VWKAGEIASEGIRQVAEWGATRHLENELKAKSRSINTIIKARGLWHPNEREKTSAAFRVDRNRHLMSLVSMIGPSPDWIVGISDLQLCLANCTWLEDAQLDLFPFDAGTDSGITYMVIGNMNILIELSGCLTIVFHNFVLVSKYANRAKGEDPPP